DALGIQAAADAAHADVAAAHARAQRYAGQCGAVLGDYDALDTQVADATVRQLLDDKQIALPADLTAQLAQRERARVAHSAATAALSRLNNAEAETRTAAT